MNVKKRLGIEISKLVKNHQVIGLGSGTTSEEAIKAIGERIKKDKLTLCGVASSERVKELAEYVGIKIINLDDKKIDWGFDGADEVERETLNLIKGGGGAMTREKIVAKSSPYWIVIVDESKLVDTLGSNFPVPVEVKIDKMGIVRYTLTKQYKPDSIDIRQRKDGNGMYLTDNGNRILDVFVKTGSIRTEWEKQWQEIQGVIGVGLFMGGYPDEVWVGDDSGNIEKIKGDGRR